MSFSRSILFADLSSLLKLLLSESRLVAMFGAKLREELTARGLQILFASYLRYAAPLPRSIQELATSEERAFTLYCFDFMRMTFRIDSYK